jgi:uncharacterized protein
MNISTLFKAVVYCSILIVILLSCNTGTPTFSIEAVPDPKSIDGGYISNPDSIISPSSVAYLNEQLAQLDASGKAQVAVVLLNTIGDNVPKDVAHELFNYWDIGEEETRNGLLIVVVKDQQRVEFETGYGLEGELPDVTCFQIQQEYIMPYLKQNWFDSALVRGVDAIIRQLHTGQSIETIDTTYDNSHIIDEAVSESVEYDPLTDPHLSEDEKQKMLQLQKDIERADRNGNVFGIWILLFAYLVYILIISAMDKGRTKEEQANDTTIIFKNEFYSSSLYTFFFLGLTPAVVLFLLVKYTSLSAMYIFFSFLGIVYGSWALFIHGYYIFLRLMLAMRYKDLSRAEEYGKLDHLHRNLKVFTFLFPLPFLLLYRVLLLKRMNKLRNAPYTCKCGSEMHKLDEWDDNAYLSESQAKEETMNSVDYDVWLCATCSETLVLYYENIRSKIRFCDNCSAKTLRQTKEETIERATESSTGIGRKYFTCSNCKATKEVEYTIPKISSSTSSSGSSGSSSSESSSSSSSWGGGSSGGGGAGSSW